MLASFDCWLYTIWHFFSNIIMISHTTAIVVITVIVSFLAWQNRLMMERLIFNPIAITRHKQYDRFITHGFIHADSMHLLFNMFTLYSFGRAIEDFYIHQFGNFGFILFYLLAIVVAIIPSFAKHKNNSRYLSLGASGAVSAVVFAYILFAPWRMLYFFGILPIPAIIFAILYIAYSTYADRRGTDNINHSAHLYGAIFGLLATIISEPAVIIHFIDALFGLDFH